MSISRTNAQKYARVLAQAGASSVSFRPNVSWSETDLVVGRVVDCRWQEYEQKRFRRGVVEVKLDLDIDGEPEPCKVTCGGGLLYHIAKECGLELPENHASRSVEDAERLSPEIHKLKGRAYAIISPGVKTGGTDDDPQFRIYTVWRLPSDITDDAISALYLKMTSEADKPKAEVRNVRDEL